MSDVCKICKVKARIHYAAGFDVWTCPQCGTQADNRTFYEKFEEVVEYSPDLNDEKVLARFNDVIDNLY
jgi:ribosomal protein L37AE/L43A